MGWVPAEGVVVEVVGGGFVCAVLTLKVIEDMVDACVYVCVERAGIDSRHCTAVMSGTILDGVLERGWMIPLP